MNTKKTAGFRGCAAALLAAAAMLSAAPVPVMSAPIHWKLPSWTLAARDMNLRTALETFAVAQGLSVVISKSVDGVFSGDFRDVPPGDFLQKLATVHNFTWYYDGAALYIYSSGEIQTMLVDLQYMKAGELRAMLAELGVEDERFPIKTASNDELVMVSGPPRYVALVAETISKADKLRELRAFNEVETRMFPLRYTWADDVSFRANSPESQLSIRGVATLLREMMTADQGGKVREAASTNAQNKAEAASKPETARFQPSISAENRLNAVVVRDSVSRMPMYERLIRQLDVPQKLVEIDVTVVELSKKDALDWQLSISGSLGHGHSDAGLGQNAANLFSPAALAGKGLAGAITHIHKSYSISASLTALREKGKARSISRTSLLTVNNLAAELTDTQSYHARVVGTEVATLEEVSAGTKLQVKPRILPSVSSNVTDQVWLSLELDDGGFETVTVDSMPMTRTSTLQTQTAVFAGDSIMLAGYLRDIDEEAGWGIPYLRDIPFIGWLFGGETVRKETVQRVFVLTPRIVDLDAETLVRLQASRLRDVTLGEEIEEVSEDVDEERALRDLDRGERREKRREKLDAAFERRQAEIKHWRTMRREWRKRGKWKLSDEIRAWRAIEETERAAVRAELDAARGSCAEKVPEPKEGGAEK